MDGKVAELLRHTALFGRLTDPQLRSLARVVKERRLGRNQLLFRQGDEADSLYVIVSGRVRVSATDRAGHERVLAFLGSGESVGEMGLLSAAPRSATVVASTEVDLAQRSPERVILVDLNILFGHAPVLLNLMPRTALAAMSAVSLRQMDRENLEFYLSAHTESSLRVLSSTLRPEQSELVTADH